MGILNHLTGVWRGSEQPFLIAEGSALKFSDIAEGDQRHLDGINPGDVVALVGDFDTTTIASLLTLIDRKAIVVPLTQHTAADHEFFFEAAHVNVVLEGKRATRRSGVPDHPLIEALRAVGHPGLVIFSTGTTGRPKAALHDLSLFLKRFAIARPSFRTLNFLLFDHIGGINTLLHTLFNKGTVIAPAFRTVDSIISTCRRHDVEALPTTPTFLRMMLMSGLIPDSFPPSLRIVTYGTETMDQTTLTALCRLLPNVDFRQQFGMSELGIIRVKSEARDSLFMKIHGEGVETRVDENGILKIRSSSRMLGYLNAPTPFDQDGWYDSKDIVEVKGDYYRVVGRAGDVVNVGGIKFMPSEVERVALQYAGVSLASVKGFRNPITGQHVEMIVQPNDGAQIDKDRLLEFMAKHLPPHMLPKRITLGPIGVGHRFKKR